MAKQNLDNFPQIHRSICFDGGGGGGGGGILRPIKDYWNLDLSFKKDPSGLCILFQRFVTEQGFQKIQMKFQKQGKEFPMLNEVDEFRTEKTQW